MLRLPKLSPRARWAVPAGAVAITGAVIAATLVPSAQASPVLPVRTGAQLLAAVGGGTGRVAPFTGTVVENASLGLPNLPGSGDPTSITSMLAGGHTIRIWYGGSGRFRVSMPGQLTESDIIRNGNTVWYWQSQHNAVTKLQLPARQHKMRQQPRLPVLTPQQAARQAIAAVGPSTRVSVQSNVVVAGQNAYQLVLAPKSTSSLIGQVRIAIDAGNSVPLRVQVFARHAASPAFQIGFQSISFVAPAAANFDFRPPPGAKVSTESPGSQDNAAPMLPQKSADGPTEMGKDWLSVAVLPASDAAGVLGGLSGKSSASASGVASSAAKSAAGTPSGGGSTGVSASALLGAMLHAATAVHGAWGSGKLLHTSLLTVLITSDGHVLIGAVTPSVLYADAAHVK